MKINQYAYKRFGLNEKFQIMSYSLKDIFKNYFTKRHLATNF